MIPLNPQRGSGYWVLLPGEGILGMAPMGGQRNIPLQVSSWMVASVHGIIGLAVVGRAVVGRGTLMLQVDMIVRLRDTGDIVVDTGVVRSFSFTGISR